MLKPNSDYRHSTHSVLLLFYPQSLRFFELFLICLAHVCVTDHIVILARANVSDEIFKLKFFCDLQILFIEQCFSLCMQRHFLMFFKILNTKDFASQIIPHYYHAREAHDLEHATRSWGSSLISIPKTDISLFIQLTRRTIYLRLQIYFNETNILNKLRRFTVGEAKS